MMSEDEKRAAGQLFCPADPILKAQKLRAHNLCTEYNQTFEDETEKREKIVHELFGSVGEGARFQGPIYIHYGIHTAIGKNFFGNFNLTIQDDAPVAIGDDCDFGTGTTIVTPIHPMLAGERRALQTPTGEEKHLCYAKPVKIGSGCWFGANVTVCPGVTIGDGCVIGAGSVVTRNIPANTFAVGVPCKVVRELTEKDSLTFRPQIIADNMPIEK